MNPLPVIAHVPSTIEFVTDRTFPFVPHLQNLHRDEVGFLPAVALREYLARSQLWLARHNGQPCGYLAWGGFRAPRPVKDPGTLKIIQACIDYDVQRCTHGATLVAALERTARDAGIPTVSLWCANDLPANLFWRALGYIHDGDRTGGSRRILHRPHRHWTKHLLPETPPSDLVHLDDTPTRDTPRVSGLS